MNASDRANRFLADGPSVLSLAHAFGTGADAPSAALARAFSRIEETNGAVNAFLHLRTDAARDEASASDARWRSGAPLSPIDGTPFGVKANIAVAGLPWHAGVGAYRDRIAAEDADVVRLLKAAGAVAVGVVNMHEGALGATTDNPHFGRCGNPWDTDLTPGGSSGGSAAAVAAGMCAFALGTDTMGSVRIPSAYCGIAGVKPTFGAVPGDGLIDLSPSLDHIGPHARSVADCAAVLSVLAGTPITLDATRRYRVAIGRWGDAVACEPGVAAGFDRAVSALREIADLTDVAIDDIDFGRLRRRGLLISEREGYAAHEAALAAGGAGFSDEFRMLLEWGHGQPDDKLDAARAAIAAAGQTVRRLIGEHDALVLPTTPQGPFPFGEDAPANQADFTALANFAGAPAVATPAAAGARNQPPPSVQFIGAPGDDATVLSLAAAFEKASRLT
ncbi:MAG: amidase [Pseudomonadota bacterium]